MDKVFGVFGDDCAQSAHHRLPQALLCGHRGGVVRRVLCVLLRRSPLGRCWGCGASSGQVTAARERQDRERWPQQRGEALERYHRKWKCRAMRGSL